MLYGVVPERSRIPSKVCRLDVDTDFFPVVQRGETPKEKKLHIAELCGEAKGKASRLAVRSNLVTGPSFDVIADVDLSRPQTRHQVHAFSVFP